MTQTFLRVGRRLVALCAGIGIGLSLQAQALAPNFGAHLNFNTADIGGGFHGGMTIVDLDLDVRADFSARIGNKRILVPVPGQDDSFYQYRESRYLLGLEVEKRITVLELGDEALFGFCAMLLGGYTFGDYHGTDVSPEALWTYRVRVAPHLVASETVVVRLGYEYSPYQSPSVPDHRAFLAISFIIPTE
jgi:hypothetical protein